MSLTQELEIVALAYEWPVFRTNGKLPLGPWKEGEPLELVAEHVAAGGNYGIALPDDVVVIDVDDPSAWAEWHVPSERIERWPPTLSVKTPSGGCHIYLRRPAGEAPIPIAQNRPCTGVDIRTKGGYVIGPSSEGYEVLGDWDIAECPAWLWPHLDRPEQENVITAPQERDTSSPDSSTLSPLAQRIADVNIELIDEAEELFKTALARYFGGEVHSYNGQELHGPCPRCMTPDDLTGGKHDRFRLQAQPTSGDAPFCLCRQCGRRTDFVDLVHLRATGRLPAARGDVLGTLVFLGRAEGLETAQTMAAKHKAGDAAIFEERDTAWDFELTDLGNAERLIYTHGERMRFVPELPGSAPLSRQGNWATWDAERGFWVPGQSSEAMTFYFAALREASVALFESMSARDHEIIDLPPGKCEPMELPRRNALRARRSWLERGRDWNKTRAAFSCAHGIPGVVTALEKFDADPFMLCTPAGVVDLRTGVLSAAMPDMLFLQQTAVGYEPNARSPRWLKFLDEIMGGDRDLIDFLQKFIGTAVLGVQYDQLMAIFHGSGCNGKTVFVETVANVLGTYARSTPVQTLLRGFTGNSHGRGTQDDVAALVGARLVYCEEPDAGTRLDEARVKALLSGARVSCRRVYSQQFEYMPQFNPIMSCNHLPSVSGTNVAIWRRIALVPFEQSFRGREDPDLAKKLQSEAAGILAWIVEGAVLRLREGLELPARVQHETDTFREESDVVSAFAEENLTPCEEGEESPRGVVYRLYRDWCVRNDAERLTQRDFNNEMARLGYPKGRSTKARFYSGCAVIKQG